MKEIFPLTGFWNNNAFSTALFLKLYLGKDDLNKEAIFYYEFYSQSKSLLARGELFMSGETYENWDGSNSAAWDFAVSRLGVILVETK